MKAALDDYHQAFSDGSGSKRNGGVLPMHITQFKDWLKDGGTKKPAV